MGSPVIRVAEPSEYEALGELIVAAYRALPPLEGADFYFTRLRDVAARAAAAEVLVAVSGGEVVGGVTFVGRGGPMVDIARESEAEIRMLAVEPDREGTGIGKALTLACIDRARAIPDCRRIVLSTRTDMAAARAMLEATKLFVCAESLGGVESLIEHPASMTHASVPPEARAELGISEGLIRLSVGLEAEADLRARGVRHAALFGSVARGEARRDSDLDIMIEVDPDARIGVYEYVDLKDYIASLFEGPVDVVSRDSLKPHVRPAVADAIYAF